MAIDADAAEDTVTSGGVEQSGESVSGQPVEPAPGADVTDTANNTAGQRYSAVWLAVVVGFVALVVLSSLTGWLGYRAHQSQTSQQQRNLFVQVGRQAAINLTTISYTEAEADVARIVDSSAGAFHDYFQSRATEFIRVVKQAQSKSQGTISEAGLESDQGGQGQVLVAVSVKTTTPADSNPQPRGWRMRITVQKTPDGPKVSNVEFVP
jgi:Mce-associated membrane protein